MKIKPIIAMLLLGTSGLGANAQAANLPKPEATQKTTQHWSNYQADQNTNPNLESNVVRYTPVPEARTILVGAVLLLPLGVSLVRNLRRNKKTEV